MLWLQLTIPSFRANCCWFRQWQVFVEQPLAWQGLLLMKTEFERVNVPLVTAPPGLQWRWIKLMKCRNEWKEGRKVYSSKIIWRENMTEYSIQSEMVICPNSCAQVRLGLGGTFARMIRAMYVGDHLTTEVNGETTRKVFLGQGVRQGCSLRWVGGRSDVL